MTLEKSGIREYRSFCLPYVMWYKESFQFNPTELVFGRHVCGPLKVLKSSHSSQVIFIYVAHLQSPVEYFKLY